MKKILVLAGCGRRRHGRVPGSCKGGCQRRQGGQCQQHRHCCHRHRHYPRLHFHSRLVIVIMWPRDETLEPTFFPNLDFYADQGLR